MNKVNVKLISKAVQIQQRHNVNKE